MVTTEKDAPITASSCAIVCRYICRAADALLSKSSEREVINRRVSPELFLICLCRHITYTLQIRPIQLYCGGGGGVVGGFILHACNVACDGIDFLRTASDFFGNRFN